MGNSRTEIHGQPFFILFIHFFFLFFAEHSFNENDIVLVAVGRLYKEKEVSSFCLLEAKKEEYMTRHEPSGKMINVDHRIAIVAGYMCEEVIGLSAFNFMHKDDVTWVMIALKQSTYFYSVPQCRTAQSPFKDCNFLFQT